MKRGNSSLMESSILLALMGILAGAIGGLAVGIVTTPKPASSTSSSSPTAGH